MCSDERGALSDPESLEETTVNKEIRAHLMRNAEYKTVCIFDTLHEIGTSNYILWNLESGKICFSEGN